MPTATERLAYTVKEAAALTPFSEDTLARAIKATDPSTFPPPLRAKRDSRGRHIILSPALMAWLDSLPDA